MRASIERHFLYVGLPRSVSRRILWRFPDFHGYQTDVGGQGQVLGNVEGDVFGGRVERRERRKLVEMAVVQRGNDLLKQSVGLVEIHDDADSIGLGRGDGYADFPIVAV